MRRILIVVGTRPNFIKVTRFKELASEMSGLVVDIVHTGQHYDSRMSDVFFDQFGLVPDYFLNIEPAAPATQMGRIMEGLEKVFDDVSPGLVMVVGDVNSTLAGALVANKKGIRLAHLESGLRSNDRSMPEEVNRILTDEITDVFFVTEQSGLDHLRASGKQESSIHFVGNTMIDTLVHFEPRIAESTILSQLNLEAGKFVLMTIHRPATVDDPENFIKLLDILERIGESISIVFPVHPRTVKNAERFGLSERLEAVPQLTMSGPLDYFAFQKLIADCSFILTDSGGIQEESTFRQVPCLTLRPNTERPSTVELGTNQLLPLDVDLVMEQVTRILQGNGKSGTIPPLWDGCATERILEVLNREL
jgi:UDP-N-acetylglucosamine 2-epimerase (non-hydrolysing)